MRTRVIRITVEIVAALTFIILPLLLVPVVSPLAVESPLQPMLRGIVFTHSVLVGLYYWNFYFAIPRLYFSGKKRLYALSALAILTVMVVVLFSNPAYNVFPSPPFRYPNFVFFMSILIRFM